MTTPRAPPPDPRKEALRKKASRKEALRMKASRMEASRMEVWKMKASRDCARWAAWTGWLFQRGGPVTRKG